MYNTAKKFQDKFLERGCDVRMFNPKGQGDIKGGWCQLWYVQNWLKEHKR